MSPQHGNRHRRFEAPRVMAPGAPETLEALDEARVIGLARMAWAQRPQVFNYPTSAEWTHGFGVVRGDRAVIIETGSATVRESDIGY